jgi:hypothetical protein
LRQTAAGPEPGKPLRRGGTPSPSISAISAMNETFPTSERFVSLVACPTSSPGTETRLPPSVVRICPSRDSQSMR